MNRADFADILGGPPSCNESAIVIEENGPGEWRRAFAAAAAGQGPVFLMNPDWGSRERVDFDDLVRRSAADWNPEAGWLMIPTGGSTGRIKLARHDQSTLLTAVEGYQAFFREKQVSAVGVLPLHHVGGLMGWLRSALSGGDYIDGDWQSVRDGESLGLEGAGKTVSLVPTQLSRFLDAEPDAEWLQQFARVLIGGAGLPSSLATRAREAGVKLVGSYGSTETAAMVAAQDYAEVDGLVVLPHASIELGDTGQIEVRGRSVCRGLWPDSLASEPVWKSGDLGQWLSAERITIQGRADDMIVTGGEKVNPREVELALQSLVGDERLTVLGVPDARWGQRVVVIHHRDLEVDLSQLKERGLRQIASYKWPKQAYPCDVWPMNSVGKLDRSKLAAVAMAASR